MKGLAESLPSTWSHVRLGDIATINPKDVHEGDFDVTFLGMKSVEAESGHYDASGSRRYLQVKKGYTCFADEDILFAKITPCMENGKVAVVRDLLNGIGCGSTEFHVIRLPHACHLLPDFYFHYVVQRRFRSEARRHMTGTAGQLRVPKQYLDDCPVPVPPLPEQHRIVAKIEELFSDLDAGVETLKAIQQQLKKYRQSVLKAAFEGKLTQEWREANKDKLEPASVLLERIQEERRKQVKEKKLKELPPIDTSELPELPEGWAWVYLAGLLAKPLTNGRSVKTLVGGFPVLRLTALQEGNIVQTEMKEGAWTSKEAEPYLVAENDFLVARGNGSLRLVGRGGLVGTVARPVAFPDTMIRICCDSKTMLPSYLRHLFDGKQVRDQIERAARTTAGIYKVNQGDLNKLCLPLPSFSEQQVICESIEDRLSIAEGIEDTLDTSLSNTSRLRQSILKRAFEGKLVPHDANDEPAEKLLERIKEERAKSGTRKPARGRKPRKRKATANLELDL